MSDEQKRILERELWNIANLLRGKMNADEYKNYILGFIFYKYLSEKQEIYVNEELGLKRELRIEYNDLNNIISPLEEMLKKKNNLLFSIGIKTQFLMFIYLSQLDFGFSYLILKSYYF
jgi:type I restriction-modification system DNA methylase subunit